MKIILFLCTVIMSFAFMEQTHRIELEKFQSDDKKVEVKGEVENPGVYEVGLHDTIDDILEVCGGVNEDADTSGLNLALDVENNSVIVVPKKQVVKKISLNSSTVEELDTLPGVGEAIAKRIIEYRTLHPFQSIEDIMEVKGIKEKLFEKIKDRISL